MAITKKDYLLLEKAGNTYMLLKSPTHFHLVKVEASLSERAYNRLMRLYPCDNDVLKEMKIHFSAFRSESLRHVVLTGGKRGDSLKFWVGTSPQEYTLCDNYSEDELNCFFCNQQRTWRVPPKWEGLAPELIHKVTFWTTALSIACSVWFYFLARPYRLMALICILWQVVSIILVSVYPESFTFLESIKKQRNHRQGCLLAAIVAPGFGLSLREMIDFTYIGNEGFWHIALVALVIWIPMALILIVRARQLREDIPEFVAILAMILFLNLGTAGYLNYLLDFNSPAAHTVEVADKHIDRGSKSTSYYVTVNLPDGELLELNVSARKYRKVAIGEKMLVKDSDGAFGIRYFTTQIISD